MGYFGSDGTTKLARMLTMQTTISLMEFDIDFAAQPPVLKETKPEQKVCAELGRVRNIIISRDGKYISGVTPEQQTVQILKYSEDGSCSIHKEFPFRASKAHWS